MSALKFAGQLFSLTACCLMGSLALSAQTNPLEAAKPLIAAKKFEEAAAVYETWLTQYPNDANIWRELGVVQSWRKQPLKGIEAFKKSLELEPDNLDAQRGIGYAYAWRGDYGRATDVFQAILEKFPTDEDTQKGLAYIALWSGNGDRAAAHFSKLARLAPENPEYHLALAQAYKIAGKPGKAAQSYRTLKKLDPDNPMLKQELASLRTHPAFAEIDIWGGYSKVATSSSDGLRLLQLALQLRDDLRVYARFDKSLSVDNLDLLRRNVRGNVYNIGALHSWNDKTATTLEAGLREFGEAQPSQYTVRAEQSYALGNNYHLKGGLMAGFSKNAPTEWVILAGAYLPVAQWLVLEPSYFFTRLNTYSFDHRVSLNSKFLPGKGYEINIGVLAGQAQIENEAAMRKLSGAYVFAVAPISRPLWLMVSYRYENGFFDELNTVALGLRLRFGQSE